MGGQTPAARLRGLNVRVKTMPSPLLPGYSRVLNARFHGKITASQDRAATQNGCELDVPQVIARDTRDEERGKV
jgi:hypothetical protein